MNIDGTQESRYMRELERIKRRLVYLEKRIAGTEHESGPPRIERDRQYMLCADVPIGYQSLDTEGRIIYVNEEWCGIFGYSATEAIGRWFGDFVDPAYRGRFRETFERFKNDGHVKNAELTVVCENGARKNISFNGKIETDDDGDMIRAHCFAMDITAQKQTEVKLRESEEKYRQLFGTVSDAVMIFDAGTRRFIDVNEAASNIYGYSRDEFLNMTHTDITVEREQSDLTIRETPSGMREFIPLRYHRKKSGEVFPVEISTAAFTYKGRSILVGIIRDISNRVAIERSLRAGEHRFWGIFENSVIGMALVDPEGSFIAINNSLCTILGYSKNEIMNMKLSDVFHVDDLVIVEKRMAELPYYESASYRKEVRCIHRNGSIVWGAISIAVERAEEEHERFIVQFQDMTGRKTMATSLHELEEKYRTLFDNVGIGISVINSRMQVVSINRQMAEWFPHVDVSKRPVCYKVFKHPPGMEICSYCPACKTLNDGNVHEAVSRTSTPKGVRNYRIVSSPLRDEKGKIVAAIETLEDITEMLKLEEEAIKNEKLRSISTLAGGIAHDFNNILASLLGNISLIKDRVSGDAELSELIGEVELASGRAKRLTQQLDLFSRGKAPLRQTMNIGDIIKGSTDFALHGSSVSCTYEFPDDLHPVDVDVDQIDQVVYNVVLNAVQAMPEGGTIKIGGKNLAVKKGNKIGLSEGDYVCISIADSGTGIPEEDLPVVFEPFFTTKSKGGGLGLAHCKTIIGKHHGTLRLESSVGVGTTMYIYLPVSKGTFTQKKTEMLKGVPGCRVLVLDDEDSMRRLLKRMLERMECTPECTGDGVEAVTLYSDAIEAGHPFDLVILDLTVRGGRGGRETMAKLREIDPDVRGIAISGYHHDPVMENYREHGFSGVIAKPFSVEELEEVMRRILYAGR